MYIVTSLSEHCAKLLVTPILSETRSTVIILPYMKQSYVNLRYHM